MGIWSISLCLSSLLVSSAAWKLAKISLSHQRSTKFNNQHDLKMVTYSSDKGVPAALVEERDACGVGFIASLSNRHSHDIVRQAVTSCSCMEHRGATSADYISGDGAGIMTSIPWKLFSDLVADPASAVNQDGSLATAVGMIFLPRNEKHRDDAVARIESTFQRNGFLVKGWRNVPVDPFVLGALSADFVPVIRQIVVQSILEQQSSTLATFERRIYDLRRQIQGYFRKAQFHEAYVCSLSSASIVYKGMLRSADLPRFYLDLVNPDYTSNFAIYHRRFSTNTVPKWFLAQPMRLLAHNGEINTLLGNINWVKSRQFARRIANRLEREQSNHEDDIEAEESYREGAIAAERTIKGPLVDVGRSDSANLDSILDSFVRAGYSPEEALMILVPEAQAQDSEEDMDEDLQAFYRYYEARQEAWDGPALLVFSDGRSVGAALDRNGLRPARYMITQQRGVEGGEEEGEGEMMVHVMSEVGVTKILSLFNQQGLHGRGGEDQGQGVQLLASGRLGPGQMLSVDLAQGKLRLNDEIKQTVARQRPYRQLVEESIVSLSSANGGQGPFQQEVERYAALYNRSSSASSSSASSSLLALQTLFGWGSEDVELQVSAMAKDGMEATYCMGDDAPLAALSALPHTLYDYFKQRFAQVTNPPIDPLREGRVMSLFMFLGPRGDPLAPLLQQGDRRDDDAKAVKIPSPVLTRSELHAVMSSNKEGSSYHHQKAATLSTLYPLAQALQRDGLKKQLDALCSQAVAMVRDQGITLLNLSDEPSQGSSSHSHPNGLSELSYLPPLLAVGAVHHALLAEGLRTRASLVVSTGQAWSAHHLACLLGYGASAVVPYAAYDAVLAWHSTPRIQLMLQRAATPSAPPLTAAKALQNYRTALEKGLLKILSKMGISLLSSYHGAQIFEALGLDDEVIATAFKGTSSRIGGMNFDEIAVEVADFSRRAFFETGTAGTGAGTGGGVGGQEEKRRHLLSLFQGEQLAHGQGQGGAEGEEEGRSRLVNYGFFNYYKASGEYHHNNQPLIKTLHAAIKAKEEGGKDDKGFDLYRLYEEAVTSRPPTTLRDLLAFTPPSSSTSSIPLEEVESVAAIMQRFTSGGMSLGALSREAHETLAIAMNRIGARSNSGEGGEDPLRFSPIQDPATSFPHLKGIKPGDDASSRIKQVASGRFGVTPAYLVASDQLEIKIAQGAKPGEGGQLPGAKIDAYIAGLRKSKPGVTLISPPPHHDIYSIEDLAQLIHDLHQISPTAPVSVKLVSEEGIGTVASGVAKAGADIIQISGHDGGTGASPATSIKHAGSPWELGLVESHAALRRNGLRNRVVLRVDGGLKSGWDVVMAAAMGAEEFGFGTIALIAEGCIMARICHTNNCPVGVTTQKAELRKRFPGTPEDVVTFFTYVAEEVRHILAKLGYRSLEEIIGRPGLLQPRPEVGQRLKTQGLDLQSFLLDSLSCQPVVMENFCDVDEDRSWLIHRAIDDHNGYTLDDRILEREDVQQAILNHGQLAQPLSYAIGNTDRSALARISGRIARLHGDHGFQGRLNFALTGAAGQSFGCFLGQGMQVKLHGFANDYVGKGMAGGSIVVDPPALPQPPASIAASLAKQSGSTGLSVVGNTVLYGATGGRLLVRGRAGERFAVRNSGAVAVVEGLGDHGCEYMTAGCVVNLGKIGRNFGAGMTGGLAFLVPDEAWLDGNQQTSSSSSSLESFLNKETVSLLPLTSAHQAAKAYLMSILSEHVAETKSARAQRLLDHWEEAIALGKVIAVVPASEKSSPLLAQATALVDAALAGGVSSKSNDMA